MKKNQICTIVDADTKMFTKYIVIYIGCRVVQWLGVLSHSMEVQVIVSVWVFSGYSGLLPPS